MGLCQKCSKITGVIVLLFGIGFLLRDWGWWTFWGLDAWTVVFVLAGLFTLCSCGCKDCQSGCGSCCEVPAAASAKKKR